MLSMLTFDQVCQEIRGTSVSLLLGNGFSIGFDPIFNYNNLKYVVFTKAFEDIDVEQLMFSVFNSPDDVVERIKKGFIDGILAIHPSMGTGRFDRCVAFLMNFAKVYTLNYDLILYWAINSDQQLRDRFWDGFGIERQQRVPEWPNTDTTTFYLHGSLILHCTNPEGAGNICPRPANECCVEKYKHPKDGFIVHPTWIDLLRTRTNSGEYPHFVSEGDARQKYLRIQKCTYLKGCYEALKGEQGNLVTYGVSFEKDTHILAAIKASRVTCCYIGVYDAENSSTLVQKAASLCSNLRTVKFYDVRTANVWPDPVNWGNPI